MFTQLSLFDSAAVLDPVASSTGFVHVTSRGPQSSRSSSSRGSQGEVARLPQTTSRRQPPSETCCEPVARPCQAAGEVTALAPQRRVREDDSQRSGEAIRPLGELAQLVLARYDLVARRRQERERRRQEQPRKSIRVLSPPQSLCS